MILSIFLAKQGCTSYLLYLASCRLKVWFITQQIRADFYVLLLLWQSVADWQNFAHVVKVKQQ